MCSDCKFKSDKYYSTAELHSCQKIDAMMPALSPTAYSDAVVSSANANDYYKRIKVEASDEPNIEVDNPSSTSQISSSSSPNTTVMPVKIKLEPQDEFYGYANNDVPPFKYSDAVDTADYAVDPRIKSEIDESDWIVFGDERISSYEHSEVDTKPTFTTKIEYEFADEDEEGEQSSSAAAAASDESTCETLHVELVVAGNDMSMNKPKRIIKRKGKRKRSSFVCEFCKSVFTQKISLTIHHSMNICGQGEHKCKECAQFFVSAEHLAKHMQTHGSAYVSRCVKCNTTYANINELIQHKRTVHNHKHECDVCQKVFPCKANLKEHHKVHMIERPFGCQLCPATFNRIETFRTHMLRHEGKKDYLCTQCNKSFVRPADLKMHERTHTNERPYFCDFCSSRFKTSYARNTHRRIHTGERPYGCQQCPMRFSDKSSCNRHKRAHAGEPNAPIQGNDIMEISETPILTSTPQHTNTPNQACYIEPFVATTTNKTTLCLD